MTRQPLHLVRTLGLAAVAALSGFASAAVPAASDAPNTGANPAKSRKPNIIFVLTDDQGAWTVGAYGNKEAKTPNLDRLASEGALFVNSFVNTPVCSPSRAAFLTGLQGTEVGITDWINMNQASSGRGLPPETTTWPEVLKSNGYATALFGKWHLGHLPQHHPTNHGYQSFWGFLGGGIAPMDPLIEIDGKPTRLKGPVPDLLTDAAIKYIESHKDQPFAVSMHFREPHLPYGPSPEPDIAALKDVDPTVPEYRDLEPKMVKNLTREYYTAVHAVDRNVGRVLDKLEELKLADNTIVIFTSDNGYNVGHHVVHGKGNGNWIGGGVHGPKRPNMFESSVRVPLIIRWPGVARPGTRVEQPVINIDTFASVLGMTGVPAPAGAIEKQHGRDFSPFLRGQTVADWRTDVFGQYDLHNAGIAFMRMIRTDEWKLVRKHMGDADNELYNLKNDPGERNNRYYDKKFFPIRDQLQTRLTAWQESIKDPILKLDANRPIEQGPPVGQ